MRPYLPWTLWMFRNPVFILIVVVVWLILIITFRRNPWGKVLWLPLFLGLIYSETRVNHGLSGPHSPWTLGMLNNPWFIMLVTVVWLILIITSRRKSWGIILWLPLFLGLTYWIARYVLPLFIIMKESSGRGPDAGFVGMGAMFALIASLPFVICWVVLLLLWPPKKTVNRWTLITSVVVCPIIYIATYLIFTNTIQLRVVDQNGEGIHNCSIAYTLVSLREKRYQGLTDPHGFFRFRTIPDMGMQIDSISAKDYELEPNTERSYKLLDNNLTNPIIFKMWSKSAHQKLLGGDKSFQILPDGRAYYINLTNDTISETNTGNLKMLIQYTNHVVQGQKHDWTAQIHVINGGLIEEKDAYSSMYIAPTNGYVPMFEQREQVKGGSRGDTGNRRFYIQLNNGAMYGSMKVELCAPYGHLYPGLIRLSYRINPSGSPLLY
jgi:hypothetical protein